MKEEGKHDDNLILLEPVVCPDRRWKEFKQISNHISSRTGKCALLKIKIYITNFKIATPPCGNQLQSKKKDFATPPKGCKRR